MTVCRSCDASIIMARSATGKPIPLDVEPVRGREWKRGLFTVHAGVAHSWRKADPHPGGPLYQTHFASCPDAERWRR